MTIAGDNNRHYLLQKMEELEKKVFKKSMCTYTFTPGPEPPSEVLAWGSSEILYSLPCMMYSNLSASDCCPPWEGNKIQMIGNTRAFNHTKIAENPQMATIKTKISMQTPI